ncbi:alpha/beta fold hydrolase [Sneathiella chungangensis]|uniref:Alpha/beta fold hydrolase n=1 Tax=Sneathiella chungangensis TaxID=1418234 RepID=A0A845MIX7_9PROT|nr:alpha/beta fold hydrolase [Sneathiella chungangensis]MZR23993.1 alpha/beta fold hydrolase [Sneathiella chungangensis]
MANLISNGLSLEYETFGASSDPAVILIAGLGFQLIDWPAAFCEALAAEKFHVVRFDNRDIGLSQKLEQKGLPDLPRLMQQLQTGQPPEVPYHLSDMAADVAGLMAGLGIDRAHMVGMSMGGMIAQLMAIFYPEKLYSLTSIMSSSGNRHLPPSTPAATSVLMSAPASQAVEDVVAFGLQVNDVIGSPGFRWDRAALEEHIRACVVRSYCPTGYLRQYAVVLAANPRVSELPGVTAPTLVIHGKDDPLVPYAAGEDTARLIPGAKLELVDGMGHDLSPALCDHLAGLLIPHLAANRAG